MRRQLKFLDYAPILHISALTGERRARLLETIDRMAASRRQRVPTPALNKFLAEVTAANPPVSPGRSACAGSWYAAQIGMAPPSFVFFTNVATTFHFSYNGSRQPAAGALRIRWARRFGSKSAAGRKAAGRGRRVKGVRRAEGAMQEKAARIASNVTSGQRTKPGRLGRIDRADETARRIRRSTSRVFFARAIRRAPT